MADKPGQQEATGLERAQVRDQQQAKVGIMQRVRNTGSAVAGAFSGHAPATENNPAQAPAGQRKDEALVDVTTARGDEMQTFHNHLFAAIRTEYSRDADAAAPASIMRDVFTQPAWISVIRNPPIPTPREEVDEEYAKDMKRTREILADTLTRARESPTFMIGDFTTHDLDIIYTAMMGTPVEREVTGTSKDQKQTKDMKTLNAVELWEADRDRGAWPKDLPTPPEAFFKFLVSVAKMTKTEEADQGEFVGNVCKALSAQGRTFTDWKELAYRNVVDSSFLNAELFENSKEPIEDACNVLLPRSQAINSLPSDKMDELDHVPGNGYLEIFEAGKKEREAAVADAGARLEAADTAKVAAEANVTAAENEIIEAQGRHDYLLLARKTANSKGSVEIDGTRHMKGSAELEELITQADGRLEAVRNDTSATEGEFNEAKARLDYLLQARKTANSKGSVEIDGTRHMKGSADLEDLIADASKRSELAQENKTTADKTKAQAERTVAASNAALEREVARFQKYVANESPERVCVDLSDYFRALLHNRDKSVSGLDQVMEKMGERMPNPHLMELLASARKVADSRSKCIEAFGRLLDTGLVESLHKEITDAKGGSAQLALRSRLALEAKDPESVAVLTKALNRQEGALARDQAIYGFNENVFKGELASFREGVEKAPLPDDVKKELRKVVMEMTTLQYGASDVNASIDAIHEIYGKPFKKVAQRAVNALRGSQSTQQVGGLSRFAWVVARITFETRAGRIETPPPKALPPHKAIWEKIKRVLAKPFLLMAGFGGWYYELVMEKIDLIWTNPWHRRTKKPDADHRPTDRKPKKVWNWLRGVGGLAGIFYITSIAMGWLVSSAPSKANDGSWRWFSYLWPPNYTTAIAGGPYYTKERHVFYPDKPAFLGGAKLLKPKTWGRLFSKEAGWYRVDNVFRGSAVRPWTWLMPLDKEKPRVWIINDHPANFKNRSVPEIMEMFHLKSSSYAKFVKDTPPLFRYLYEKRFGYSVLEKRDIGQRPEHCTRPLKRGMTRGNKEETDEQMEKRLRLMKLPRSCMNLPSWNTDAQKPAMLTNFADLKGYRLGKKSPKWVMGDKVCCTIAIKKTEDFKDKGYYLNPLKVDAFVGAIKEYKDGGGSLTYEYLSGNNSMFRKEWYLVTANERMNIILFGIKTRESATFLSTQKKNATALLAPFCDKEARAPEFLERERRDDFINAWTEVAATSGEVLKIAFERARRTLSAKKLVTPEYMNEDTKRLVSALSEKVVQAKLGTPAAPVAVRPADPQVEANMKEDAAKKREEILSKATPSELKVHLVALLNEAKAEADKAAAAQKKTGTQGQAKAPAPSPITGITPGLVNKWLVSVARNAPVSKRTLEWSFKIAKTRKSAYFTDREEDYKVEQAAKKLLPNIKLGNHEARGALIEYPELLETLLMFNDRHSRFSVLKSDMFALHLKELLVNGIEIKVEFDPKARNPSPSLMQAVDDEMLADKDKTGLKAKGSIGAVVKPEPGNVPVPNEESITFFEDPDNQRFSALVDKAIEAILKDPKTAIANAVLEKVHEGSRESFDGSVKAYLHNVVKNGGSGAIVGVKKLVKETDDGLMLKTELFGDPKKRDANLREKIMGLVNAMAKPPKPKVK
ncbi:MAG: hypothetical protein V1827_02455 [Candidatus Micrarchaeota archaeon]